MKAMIFAAGLGTRLRPLTDHMPKALVPVAGKPMLERVILRLKEAGFNEITVNIHHFGEQIIDFLRAHDNFGTEIHISDERGMLLDTGGLYRHHLESDAESTLLVSERKTSRYLLFDDDYHLHGWINKSTGEVKPAGFDYRETKYRELAFGGIHIISPSLFHLMDDGQWNGKFSIIPFYLSACTKVHIQGYPLQGFRWFDIGKPETLAQAEEYYKQK